ncbi:MAG TPA: histidine phosphatase family protein [Ignavibacteriaceae bacterium]|nr:histidine phosphatase family protein [Ignavibacteriaceae bacterium]
MKKSTKVFLSLFYIVFTISGFSQDIANKESRGTRTIFLIRHGEYSSQMDNKSDAGKRLTPLGIAQARLVSARLKAMNTKFNSLISSTMTRARETAEVINRDFPEMKLEQSDLIRECTPPTWRNDIMADRDSTDIGCVENLERAFKKYFVPSPDGKDRNDIIVCHGNVIRYFVTKVLKVDEMSWLQMSISNCSLTIVRILPDERMKLDVFSDYGHIPENMRTFTGGENKSKELLINKENIHH